MNRKNFLDKKPIKNPEIKYNVNENNVIIIMRHKGFFNRLAQLFFKAPKTSHISLEKYGSFIWRNIDGKKTVYDIGLCLDERFGNEATPIFVRLVQYMRILKNNGFIKFSC